jgi:hypothetical protein
MSESDLRFDGSVYWRLDAHGNTVAGPFCPKRFADSGRVSEMETWGAHASGHFANFRELICNYCLHAIPE